jgi:hypothetical protein
MGTRGFVALRDEQRTVAAYNHYDSYPSFLGVRVVEFVRTTDLEDARAKFKAVMLVDENAAATPEQLEKLPTIDGRDGDWYGVLRDLQGDLQGYLDAGVMPVWDLDKPDAALTATDSWLEWGYVVDLHAEKLEVFDITHGLGPKRVAGFDFAQLRAAADPADLFVGLEG